MARARAQQLRAAALPDFVPVRVPAVRQTVTRRVPDVVDITVDSVQLERVRVTGRFLRRHGDVTPAVRQVVVLVRGQRQLVLVLAVDDVRLARGVVMRRRIVAEDRLCSDWLLHHVIVTEWIQNDLTQCLQLFPDGGAFLVDRCDWLALTYGADTVINTGQEDIEARRFDDVCLASGVQDVLYTV